MSVRRRASGRVHYNYFRDYDPATGGYVESDPVRLKGGINTYAYAGGRPNLSIDPLGLFQLNVAAQWQFVENTPSTDRDWYKPRLLEYMHGQIPLGEVGGLIRGVRCSCRKQTCSNNWSLSGCSASLLIDVQIRSDLHELVEPWVMQKEAEHVQDYRDGAERLMRTGSAVEARLKKRDFSNQADCELTSARTIANALRWSRMVIWYGSRERDLNGSHTPPVATPFK